MNPAPLPSNFVTASALTSNPMTRIVAAAGMPATCSMVSAGAARAHVCRPQPNAFQTTQWIVILCALFKVFLVQKMLVEEMVFGNIFLNKIAKIIHLHRAEACIQRLAPA